MKTVSLRFYFKVEQPLPPGVSQKDIDLYKEIRDKAVREVTEVMNAAGKMNLAVATTNLTMLSPPSIALAAQERCPAAIEFGEWEIDTWYSSPFPQEYARFVESISCLVNFSYFLLFNFQTAETVSVRVLPEIYKK